MLPSTPVDDPIDVDLVNPEYFRQVLLGDPTRSVQAPDLADILLGQFSKTMLGATVVCAMSNSVPLVLLARTPSEVDQAVVGRVPVEVPAFHPFRAWANESFENEPVNPEHT